MREVTTHRCGAGMDEEVTIKVLDEPGPGGACHLYAIQPGGLEQVDTFILFQKGPVAEVGPNGISCEALLAVVADRLQSFQAGPYPCPENAQALENVKRAIGALHGRTIDRAKRTVEGTTNA